MRNLLCVILVHTNIVSFFHGFSVPSQYPGVKKFDFWQKSNFLGDPPRFIEKIRFSGVNWSDLRNDVLMYDT
jgi:hypothetical protein